MPSRSIPMHPQSGGMADASLFSNLPLPMGFECNGATYPPSDAMQQIGSWCHGWYEHPIDGSTQFPGENTTSLEGRSQPLSVDYNAVYAHQMFDLQRTSADCSSPLISSTTPMGDQSWAFDFTHVPSAGDPVTSLLHHSPGQRGSVDIAHLEESGSPWADGTSSTIDDLDASILTEFRDATPASIVKTDPEGCSPPAGTLPLLRCTHPSCSSKLRFARQQDLDKHARQHNRGYFCREPGCIKQEGTAAVGFLTTKDRDRHERAHNPSIPCRLCGRLFSRQDNLRDHVRRRHKLETRK